MAAIAADAEALTRFVAYTTLYLACAIAAVYAARNRRHGTIGVAIWRYVIAALLAGFAFAVVGAIEALAPLAASAVTAVRQVFHLFFIVLLSLSMRELYYELPHRSTEEPPVSLPVARLLEAGFMAVVLLEFVAVIAIGVVDVVRAVQAVGSTAFAAYGISFAVRVRSDTASTGTVVDVMLFHVIAVLTCLGTLGLVQGGLLVGVPPVLVASITSVFIVMSATFLVTLAVRLKQNVDAVSV